MKLILTQEVDGLGAAGDVVEVKDGYGRNFLTPRGFAKTDDWHVMNANVERYERVAAG